MGEKENGTSGPAPRALMRDAYARKVTWIGLIINMCLAGFKFAAGFWGHSQALVADAIHSLTDATTDIAVIAGSHYWSRPPDEDHPYGHRRLETLVSVFIGMMLVAAGIAIGWDAVANLRQTTGVPPGWTAALAALVSIIVKEFIYRWTAAAGKRIKSSALAANAWHHRSDAISSLPVLVAVGGAMAFPSWWFLDRVGAAVVSIFIIHASIKIIWPAISELIDAGAPADLLRQLETITLKNNRIIEVHGLRTRFVSTSIQVDLHIVVDGSISVREGHEIADDVRDRIIAEIEEVVDVVVHVDPPESARFRSNIETAPSTPKL